VWAKGEERKRNRPMGKIREVKREEKKKERNKHEV
jgi:hypothetical protein